MLTIAVILLALTVGTLVKRVLHLQKVVSAIMDMLITKWTLEMQINKAQVEMMVDETIERIQRENE